MEVANDLGPRLAAEVLAMKINGVVTDIRMPVTEDAVVHFEWEDDEGKQVFWHSSSHLMAAALEAVFRYKIWHRAGRRERFLLRYRFRRSSIDRSGFTGGRAKNVRIGPYQTIF